MEHFRPFIGQLQLAKCQYKAAKAATLPLEQRAYLQGGFLALQMVAKSWIQAQLSLSHKAAITPLTAASSEPPIAIAQAYWPEPLPCDLPAAEQLPSNLRQLVQSPWYQDFLASVGRLKELNLATPYVPQDSDLIAVAATSPGLNLQGLQSFIAHFEQYFDSLLSIAEEY